MLNNEPVCGIILDNIGNAYYGKRNYDDSLSYFKRAS
jgi:hypothetical protein